MRAISARAHMPTPTVRASRKGRPTRRAMPPALRIWPTMTRRVRRTTNPTWAAVMSKVTENPREMKKIGPRKE